MSMENRRILLWRITGILIFLLIFVMISVSATDIPDMKGTWTAVSIEQYSPGGGFKNVTQNSVSYIITSQDGRACVGEQMYYDSKTGKNMTEIFSGALSPDGRMFEVDNEGSGISFGEIVSDHEFYNTMMFPERGPMIIFFHMVKAGTNASPSLTVPELVGTWNLTHDRRSAVSTPGLITIDQQQGRVWRGTEQVQDEDGAMINATIAGSVGESGIVYATSDSGAYMFGSLAGDDGMQSAFIIPGDRDETYTVDRELTKNGVPLPQPDLEYPVIRGDWKIDDRKIIQNGKITDVGPVSGEWLSFSNQTGRFFTAVRNHQTANVSAEMEGSGIFRSPDEAFLTGADAAIEIYHVIDNATIEAIVNQKDNNALLYLDLLTRKTE